MRRTWLIFLVVAVTAGLVAPILVKEAPPVRAEADSAPEPKQVIDNDELMKLLFDPLYVDLRNGLREEPEGRQEWRRLYIAAYSLAEITNLLFSREGEDYMATPEWDVLVLEARDATEAVGEGIRAMDYELTKANYMSLIETCNKCHTTFEPDNATLVEPFINESPQDDRPSLL
jgi:hypothetical protein